MGGEKVGGREGEVREVGDGERWTSIQLQSTLLSLSSQVLL